MRLPLTVLAIFLLCSASAVADTSAADSERTKASAQSKSPKANAAVLDSKPADRTGSPRPAKSKRGKNAAAIIITPERETAALSFANEHHPELANLVKKLKKRKKYRRQYERAIRELIRTNERLARLADRDPQRHALLLKIWEHDSRIRLLAARTTMSSDPKLERRINNHLTDRIKVRLQLLTMDQTRLQSRSEKLNKQMKKIGQQIDTIVSDPARAAEQELQRLKKSLRTYTIRSKKRPKRSKKTVPVSKDSTRPLKKRAPKRARSND